MSTEVIGAPVDRVDGPEKVSGTALYTSEIPLVHIAYAVIIGAGVASGRVTSIDTSDAMTADGVLGILTHDNTPKIAAAPHLLPSLVGQPAPGESFFPMQDNVVHYWGQPVAVLVADSHERAQYAASLIRVTYEKTPLVVTIDQGRDRTYPAERIFGGLMPGRNERGDVKSASASADVTIDVTYTFAANHHNTLEPSNTTATWDKSHLTIHDSTMGVRATHLTTAALLGVPLADVRVITHFVGGGFGGKAMVWPHVTLAAMASKHVGRPVKLVLTRPQTYTAHGHREEQEHRMTLSAGKDGKLVAMRHEKISVTSPFDDWAEPATGVSSLMYMCPNYLGAHHLIRGNTMTPTFTRAPGESLGVFTLETTMDELAYALGMDPVELRLRNHGPTDAMGQPWSSDGLAECIRLGADRFGWANRDHTPRSKRDGQWLIGTGMAAAGYPVAFFMPVQQARARMLSDGSAVVQTSAQEFGIGVVTIMTQVAAEILGLPMDKVRVEAGDTDLPNTTSFVGSMGATMASSAVYEGCVALRDELIRMAVADEKSPLHGLDPKLITVDNGGLTSSAKPGAKDMYAGMLQRNRRLDVEMLGTWNPPPPDTPKGLLTFGAQFAEVAVDPEIGLVRVRRMLGAFAPGRVLNPKLARSQLMGGMLWGLGQALLEGNHMDPRSGRWMANNLGEYLVAVNADAPDVTVEFVEVDEPLNPLGVKGVGEIGQVGSGAAIANAVFHAIGRRVRELPMAPELVMDPESALV